jgi:hypothetical protein
MAATSDQARWGAQLADALRNCPNLASAVRGGLSIDCSQFIATASENEAFRAQFTTICDTLEGAFAHLVGGHDVTIAELQQQNADLWGQLAAKTSLADRLAESIANSNSRGGGTARRISTDPEKFSGTEKDIPKRQQKYVNWRSQINRCFGMDREVFNTEYRKIQHISSLLTDDAYDVNRDHFDTITENPDDPEQWYWKTAEKLFDSLNAQYQTLDLSLQASQDFDNLYMTNKPFQNFIAEFNTLATKCGKTPEQKVEALRKKVSREISDALTMKTERPAKTDFDGWSAMCQKLYNNLQEQKHIDRLRNFRPSQQSRPNPQPQAPPPAESGDPMVLDAARQRPTRDQCRQFNLCFYCKKPGHIADDCEEKKRSDARWGQRYQPQNQGYGRGQHQSYGRSQNPQGQD